MPASDRPWSDITAFLKQRADPTLASKRVRDFMAVVSRIEADATCSSYSRAQAICERYAASLDELDVAGELTPEIKKRLTDQVELSLEELGQMTDDFGDQLNELARAYRAPESRALGARLVIYSVVSIVGFLILLQLGVGPAGILLALILIGVVGAFKLDAERNRAPWDKP